MKVIVSDILEDSFTQFKVVKKFSDACNIKGLTTLIIHKSSETDFNAGVYISKLHKSGVSNFVYICKEPSTMISMVVSGVNGKIFNDEFYFDEEEELLSLLEELNFYDSEGEDNSLAAPALSVIGDFIGAYTRGEERINAPIYLERVNRAMTSLVETNKKQEVQLMSMGNTAIDIFAHASSLIQGLSEQKRDIEAKLDELSSAIGNTNSSRPSLGDNIFHFAPYRYMGNSKILLIREYSPTRYLTSLCLGYLHHLHYEKNKRVKLVFVHQRGAGVSAKYSGFTNITNESCSIMSLYDAEIIATNNPKKEVMKELLSKPLDVIVVVDRLYSNQDIVSGRINRICAASSRGDIERYGLNPADTIFPITKQPVQLFHIPHLGSFPKEPDGRFATYAQEMEKQYSILDSRLGI